MSLLAFETTSFIFPAAYPREFKRCTQSPEDRLTIAVKRYTPLNNPYPGRNDVSFVVAHANGFHKELYEPFLDELLARSEHLGFKIRNVWAMDAAHQGESGVLNEYTLGDQYAWDDGARDIEVMIRQFDIRQPLIGIGHSLGGYHMVLASLRHPRLFVAIIGMDPVIGPLTSLSESLAASSAKRRDIWTSREDAAKYFSSRPFYQNWDPRVLKLHLKYGLRDLPTATYPDKKGVTLTTTKHQEVWTFKKPTPDGIFDPFELRYVEDQHRYVAEYLSMIQCSTFFLVGGKSAVAPPKIDNSPKSELVVMKNAGHLIPIENPSESADIIAPFCEKCLKRYIRERDEDEKTPRDRYLDEKIMGALKSESKL
ncbi:Peroxisomal membrane protein LPX1 [Neolecta irregularis DAH-3]|uniref:Peroxisomal membrane protein LPX1 n=1 Tax=Neolecta irregularis (strain DAH-3) TaxID=1198029 RepID=A0A1U7LPK6_NEOID|nr:Peroxisomal membrane protein LPX1 [Neolecta irregularis DAH-3]|eukprot:OLL24569.1 Peroxisomal membrane protein LPX1 [Neolecta irregularis DAH-3]